MSNQLVKRDYSEGYRKVFPKTYIDAIKDRDSGMSLAEILQSFNMYFLSYNGNKALTRCSVPPSLRKEGLWITYVLYDHTVITEWYNSDNIDNESFGSDDNWRQASNMLVGDISVSTDGYWVIEGKKTSTKAQGETGITPLLRFGDNNKLQASYNEGKEWEDISDDITNNLKISKYIGINEALPTSGIAEGTIYMKGPYYDENDTNNDNPIYRMWVYAWKGNTLAWQDNGEFTSISAGIVQEAGSSTAKVMSQDAVTRELTKLSAEIANVENTLDGTTQEMTTTEFTDKGKFLYNNSTLDSAQYNISDYINIKGATRIIITNVWGSATGLKGYVIYDVDKKIITSNANPTTTGLLSYVLSGDDIPQNAVYLRATENTAQKDYPVSIVVKKEEKGLVGRVEELENKQDDSGEGENTCNISVSVGQVKNLITDFTTFSAQHLNTQNGELAASASFTTSTFIAVNAATAYAGGVKDLKHGGYKETTLQEICFYDSNQQFLSAVTSKSTFTTPENTAFIRFSVLSSVSMGEKGIDDIAMCEIVEGNAPISVFSKDFIDNAIVRGGLYGKKWLLIGDSNTEHNARAAAKYDEFIASDTGVVPTNIGKSGAGYRVYQNTDYVFLNILNKFIQNNSNYVPDFITIMGGSNDVVYDWENVGTKDDTTDATIFGMAHILVERIKELFPTTPFAVLTPFPHDYEDPQDNDRLNEFVTELKAFCKDKNIPCLDLQYNSGIRPTEAAFNKKYFSCAASPNGDGLHLNYWGQQLIASRIKAFLIEYYGYM